MTTPQSARRAPATALAAVTIVGLLALSSTAHAVVVDDPPTAEAGDNQLAGPGQLVELDGSGSFDDLTASEDLVYIWSLVGPTESLATLQPGPQPWLTTFTADVPGDYVVGLKVREPGDGGQSSALDLLTVSVLANTPPNADAGDDVSVPVGQLACLDAGGSDDPDGGPLPLAFTWTVSDELGASVPLTQDLGDTACFSPAAVGSYKATLTVWDGVDAATSEAKVVAILLDDFMTQSLTELQVFAQELPAASFTSKGNRKSVLEQITKIIEDLSKGKTVKAADRAEKLLYRTDTCYAWQGMDPETSAKKKDYLTSMLGCGASGEFGSRLQVVRECYSGDATRCASALSLAAQRGPCDLLGCVCEGGELGEGASGCGTGTPVTGVAASVQLVCGFDGWAPVPVPPDSYSQWPGAMPLGASVPIDTNTGCYTLPDVPDSQTVGTDCVVQLTMPIGWTAINEGLGSPGFPLPDFSGVMDFEIPWAMSGACEPTGNYNNSYDFIAMSPPLAPPCSVPTLDLTVSGGVVGGSTATAVTIVAQPEFGAPFPVASGGIRSVTNAYSLDVSFDPCLTPGAGNYDYAAEIDCDGDGTADGSAPLTGGPGGFQDQTIDFVCP